MAVDQEVRCPDCPSEFADHVSTDWFQRLCLINGVEWSGIPQLSDCSVCMEAMTVENSIQVPCCGQFVHTLSRSIFLFPWGGLPFLQSVACRFCQIFVISGFLSLSWAYGRSWSCPFQSCDRFPRRSWWFSSSTSNPPSLLHSRRWPSWVRTSGWPSYGVVTSSPVHWWRDVVGPLVGLSFLWSIHFASWHPSVGCSFVFSMFHCICHRRAVRFCVPCQRVVSHDSSVANPVSSSQPSSVDPPDWFSFVCRFIVWVGFEPPQSSRIWDAVLALLSVDLLGLAHAKSNRGIPPYSTGSREHVPPEQCLFWSTHVPHIIQVYATHFLSLDSQQPAAIALQSWQGGHLNSVAQELVTPPDILSMMSVWLSEAVAHLLWPPPSCCPPVLVPPHSCLSDPNRVSPPSPFSVVSHSPPVPPSPSPFASLQRPSVTAPDDPLLSLALLPHIQQSLFLPARQYSSFHHFACWGILFDTSLGVWPTSVDPSGDASGPVRQHCDCHDQWWSVQPHWSRCLAPRRSDGLGCVVEDQSLGFFARLSCGTAHWPSTVQPLLWGNFCSPIFQDWTHATMASLPSVSQVGNHQATEAPSCVPLDRQISISVPSHPRMLPMPQPSSPCAPPHRCQGCQELMSIVRRLTFQLQRHSRRRSTASSLPQVVQPQFLQRKCQLHPPLPPQLELLPPPVPRVPFHHPLRSRRGSLSCPLSAPQGIVTFTATVTVVTSSTLQALPLTLPPLLCTVRQPSSPSSSSLSCSWLPFASTLPLHSGLLFSPLYKSRKVPPSHPSTPVAASMPAFRLHRACSTRLSSSFLQSPLHQPSLCGPRPSFPVGKRSGGGLPTDNGTVNPSSVVHSFGLGHSIVVVFGGAMGLCTTGSWDSSVVWTSSIFKFSVSKKHSLLWWELFPPTSLSVTTALLEVMAARRVFCSIPRLLFQGLWISSLSVGVWSQVSFAFAHSTRHMHLCRCPCGVLAHIGRFCTSCLTHPSRVADVACWGLQCVVRHWTSATRSLLCHVAVHCGCLQFPHPNPLRWCLFPLTPAARHHSTLLSQEATLVVERRLLPRPRCLQRLLAWLPSLRVARGSLSFPLSTSAVSQHCAFFRAHFWSEWLDSVQSLSHRDPRLASSLIRRTFRTPTTPPNLCNMNWGGVRSSASPLMMQEPTGVPTLLPPLQRTACSLMTSSSHSLSVSRHSRLHMSRADLTHLSLTELVAALSKCHESAPGADGLPYSAFKVSFPWWRHLLLSFFNLILRFAVVPSAWKSSLVVPLFKRDGDPTFFDSNRPISLASCAFKVFEHLVHARIAPHISPQLDVSQGGFRWGADTLVCSLVDSLRLRHQSGPHFCCFHWHQESFRLLLGRSHIGSSPWRGHLRSSLASPCQFPLRHPVPGPSGRLGFPTMGWLWRRTREGPLTSPVQFAGGQPCHLSPCCRPWCPPCGLGPVPSRVPSAQAHLQDALDVVHTWGLRWRFSFGIGPSRRLWSSVLSAAAPIVPCILGASLSLWCHNTGTSVSLLPLLSLGSSRWPGLRSWWSPLPPSLRLVSWRRFASLFLLICLRFWRLVWSSSVTIPQHFSNSTSRSVVGAGWPSASPVAAVHWELGIGDARLALGRAFSLFGRLCAMDHSSSRPPDPATVFRLCSTVQGTWSQWCASALRSLSVPHPGHVGISLGSPPSAVRRWFSRKAIHRLDRDLRLRLAAVASDLHGVRVDVSSDNFLPARENPVHSFNLPPSAVRLWGLARWGHDLSPPAIDLGLPLALSAMMWMVLSYITSPLAPPTSMLGPTYLRLHGTVGCSTPSTSRTRRRQSGPTFALSGSSANGSNHSLGNASLLRSLVLHPRLSSQLVTLVFYGPSLNDCGCWFSVELACVLACVLRVQSVSGRLSCTSSSSEPRRCWNFQTLCSSTSVHVGWEPGVLLINRDVQLSALNLSSQAHRFQYLWSCDPSGVVKVRVSLSHMMHDTDVFCMSHHESQAKKVICCGLVCFHRVLFVLSWFCLWAFLNFDVFASRVFVILLWFWKMTGHHVVVFMIPIGFQILSLCLCACFCELPCVFCFNYGCCLRARVLWMTTQINSETTLELFDINHFCHLKISRILWKRSDVRMLYRRDRILSLCEGRSCASRFPTLVKDWSWMRCRIDSSPDSRIRK